MRPRAILLLVGALALVGCGSHRHRATSPPPAPRELIRQTLAAAVASPGVRYDLEVTLRGGDRSQRLDATGAIGADVLSAQVRSTFPFLLQAATVGRDWGYIRTVGRWYGPAPDGLAKIWPRVRTAVASHGGSESFVTGGVAVSATSGEWRLTGRASRGAIALLEEVLGGSGRPDARATRLSKVELDVDAATRLPRRIVLETEVSRTVLVQGAPAAVRGMKRVRVHATMTFSDWGHPPAAQRPAHALPWQKFLDIFG
jgi:hypothetical protein